MRIKLIGTGSGKTSINRNHSSILITDKNINLLIDTGDGISRALLKQGIEFNLLTDLIISHNHPDHLAGLFSLINQMKLLGRKKSLRIFVHQYYINNFWELLNSFLLFEERIDFKIELRPYINEEVLSLDDNLTILPRKNSHILEKEEIKSNKVKWNSSSFYISNKGLGFVYTADIGCSKDLEIFNDLEFTALICETTHVSLNEIEEYSAKNNSVRVYLTHIDEELDIQIYEWYKRLNKLDKEKIIVTYDGLELYLSD